MRLVRFVGLVCLATALAAGQAITTVVNAASNNLGAVTNSTTTVAALPNAGIAQGSIFIVYGTTLGPATIAVDPNPFQDMSIGGTSMAITAANGAIVNVPMYYASATQVSGLLPSNTPVGAGTITVTYDGQASNAQPIAVVANNAGIFTVSQNGQGVGIVTYADYSLVSTNKAANTGDTLILWATGLGPVTGNELSGAQLGVNMPSIPLTVWLGGVQASVSYQGRSGCCIGEDQIIFTVPNNVPTGCAVPLMIQIGNSSQISNNTVMISNNVVIPVASGSRTCTPSSVFSANVVQQLTNGAPVALGTLNLEREISSNSSNGLVYEDAATGLFGTYTAAPSFEAFAISYLDSPPVGTCLISNSLSGANVPPQISVVGLDAGVIDVDGPNEPPFAMMEKPGGTQLATEYGVVLSATGTYLSRGNYSVVGAGGKDVGKFSASFSIGSIPVWNNQTAYVVSGHPYTVTRANGVTLTWPATTAIPTIQINGSSPTDTNFSTGAFFSCTADASAGTFTVPPQVLAALPTGLYFELTFQPTLSPVPFTASGLDLGSVSVNYLTALFGTLQ